MGGLLAAVKLRHAAHPATTEARVLVAVAPAVHGSLDQATLSAQRHVEMRQGPTYTVAIRLVHQTVPAVLLLGAARPGIDTVLLLELGRQLVRVDRLDVAPDGILHLYPVPRVFKGDPLDAIAILSHNGRGRGGDRAGRGVGVHAGRMVSGALELSAVLLVVSGGHGR